MAMLFTVEFLPLGPSCFDEEDCSAYAVKLSIRGSLGLDEKAPARPTEEERNGILDLFRN